MHTSTEGKQQAGISFLLVDMQTPGIGMTEEYLIGHYYKRAIVANLLLASSDIREAQWTKALQTELLGESQPA